MDKILVVKPSSQILIHDEEHIKAKITPERAEEIIKDSDGDAQIYKTQNLCLSYNDDTIKGDELFLLISSQ